jgi:hypothetical protein
MNLNDLLQRVKNFGGQVKQTLQSPAPQWMQNTLGRVPDAQKTLQPTFNAMGNVNTRPLSSRADSTFGQIAGGIVETPFTFLSAPTKFFGRTAESIGNNQIFTPQGMKQTAGLGLETGLDVASMGLASKLKALGILAKPAQGTLTNLIKTGARQGLKTGMGYGGGYSVAGSLQNNEDLKTAVANFGRNVAMGGIVGGALGGGVPMASGLYKAKKFDLNRKSQIDFIPQRKVWQDDLETRNFLPENIKLGKRITLPAQAIERNPAQFKTALGEVGQAMPRPGFNLKEVGDDLTQQARKYKSAEEFVAKIRGSATQYEKYNPKIREAGNLGTKRLPDLGIDPEKEITIYRGIDEVERITGKIKKTINDGDFVTTDYDSALSYASSPKNVVSKKVKAKDLFLDSDERDFIEEPFFVGSEYVYSTKYNAKPQLSDSQLTDIWNKANQSQVKKTLKEIGDSLPRPGMTIKAVGDNPKQAVPDIKTQKNQFAEQKEMKKLSTIFPDEQLENQYQAFSELYKKARGKSREVFESMDVDRIKQAMGGKVAPNQIDDIFYSQSKRDDEVLDMFMTRKFKERDLVDEKFIPKEQTLYGVKVKGGEGNTKKISITNERTGLPTDKTKTLNIRGGEGRTLKIKPTQFAEEQFKDISSTQKGFRDVYRNIESFFGKQSGEVKRRVIEPLEQGKKVMFSNLENHAKNLEKIVAKGFKKGSDMSADLQRFGEGNLSQEDIVKKYGQNKLKDFTEANNWFRKQYDTLLDEVNATRAQIYPNNPDKIIPKRKDYYRHFQEMQEGIGGLMNIFDNPAGVANNLAGVSQFAKPKSKWLSLAQRRLGNKTTEDATGGFINYAQQAEYAKNIDPSINNFRKLQEQITQQGEKTGQDYNNMIEFLQDYADDLSGKTNPLDRGLQKYIPGGRKAFKALTWLNNRVKANTILGNASSAMAQIFNVPQGIASAGEKNFVKGMVRLGRSIGQEDAVMRQSTFLKERYFKGFDKFDTGVLKQPKRFAVWMISALDELGTKAIWNAHYEKAIKEGIKNPINYADDLARKMVAGRGIGEVPLVQKSKAFQLVAPFQLEVANVWHVYKDFGSKGEVGKIMKMMAYTFLFNQAVKKVRGSDVAFDPINSLIEGGQSFNEEEDKSKGALKFVGRQVGEVLSNVPLGQTGAQFYPEYGFEAFGKKFPTREEAMGEGDPTRFGPGLLSIKGLQDPLSRVLPPFGGVQAKRTYEGIKSQMEGSVETKSGKTMFPITETNPIRTAQRAVFGKYSTPEAQEYFDEKRTPLGDVQTEKFKLAGKDYYDKVMTERASDKEKTAKTGNVAQASLGEGMKQLSNGGIYVLDLDKTFKTPEQAQKGSGYSGLS